MVDLMHYPEDRDELFEVPEEEAHFYFSLMEIESNIEKYGAHFVLSRMRNDAFSKLAEWFAEIETTSSKKACALLKKNNVS
jgi:hypothetical protein